MYVNPALLALYGYSIVWGFLTPLTLVGAGYMTNLVNAMIMTFIMLWWAQLDAMKRGRSISTWLRWLVVLTGPIGLVVHFLQTRSIFGASLAIIATVLVVLVSLVFVAIGAAFAWFACQLYFMQAYCRPEFLGG